MERILALSLVSAGPGNIFGPGMSAGALESFARGGRAKAEVGGRGAAGGARSTAATPASDGKSAAERPSEAAAKGVGGQEGRGAGAGAGADADARFHFHSALDGMFCFEAAVPPY